MLRVYQSFNFDNLNSENQQSKFRPDMNTHQKAVHCQDGITPFHVPNEWFKFNPVFNKYPCANLREFSMSVMWLTSWYWTLKVGYDLSMLMTEFRCWWHLLNVGARRQCIKKVDIGDKNHIFWRNSQNRHQHISSTTFVINIDVNRNFYLISQLDFQFWALRQF